MSTKLPASFGGQPSDPTDVIVSAVFIVIYAFFVYVHKTIHRRNKQVDHFFIFTILTFCFCMSRIGSFVMQILWAKNPESVTIIILANITISLGVVLIFITNMNFAQRIARAFHPRFNNSKPFQYCFIAYYASLVPIVAMVIATTVQASSATDPSVLNTDLIIRKFASVWSLIFVFAPIPIVLVSKHTSTSEQNFGKKGSLMTKVIIVLVISATLTISTGVRISGTLSPPRPSNDPYWFETRPVFYIFLGVLEIFVVALLAVTEADQRFFIPGKAEREAEEKTPSLTPEGVPTYIQSQPQSYQLSERC